MTGVSFTVWLDFVSLETMYIRQMTFNAVVTFAGSAILRSDFCVVHSALK
jgi:hypothetical protein